MNGDSLRGYDEISLDGFKVVRSTMFCRGPHMMEPMCTIWPFKIIFNKSAIKALNMCDYVRFEVNPDTKGFLVVPCTSKDEDSIKWLKGEKDPQLRNLQSAEFGSQLYKSWNLDETCTYKTAGRLVVVNQKVMLFFDFSRAEKRDGKRE